MANLVAVSSFSTPVPPPPVEIVGEVRPEGQGYIRFGVKTNTGLTAVVGWLALSTGTFMRSYEGQVLKQMGLLVDGSNRIKTYDEYLRGS